jgi:hypothetical protein
LRTVTVVDEPTSSRQNTEMRPHRSRDGRRRQSKSNDRRQSRAPAELTTTTTRVDLSAGSPSDVAQALSEASATQSSRKTPVIEMVTAGLLLSAGTVAMVLSVDVGGNGGKDGDQAWTVIGSSCMGLGSLLMVVGVCWYLAKTSHLHGNDQATCGTLHEVRVDATQLEALVQRGYHVQNTR